MGQQKTGRAALARHVGACLGALAVAAMIAWPAHADEMDDLRAENAELRSMVMDLANEVKDLKGMVQQYQQSVAEVKESAVAPESPEKMVTSGKDKVKLSISGQVNRMAMFADNGDESRWFQADNDNSSTRLRLQGKAQMDEEWSAGTEIEVQFESNSSADVTINQNAATIASNSFTERKLELYVENKKLGKLTLGQGSTASDTTSETDLSGTSVIAKPEPRVLGRSIAFVLSGTNGTSSGTTIGGLFNNFDGLSLTDRLRYDSPEFGGAVLSTSWVDGDAWDVALRYGREFNGTEIALAGSYWDASPTSNAAGFSTSGSVLLPFGTNFTAAYAMLDSETVGRDTADFLFLKLGQMLDLFPFGGTATSVDYSRTMDQTANGNEGTSYGLALVQKVDDLGTELYGTVRKFEADIPNLSTEDITVGGLGARVKF